MLTFYPLTLLQPLHRFVTACESDRAPCCRNSFSDPAVIHATHSAANRGSHENTTQYSLYRSAEDTSLTRQYPRV
ncbi:hypothetical protein BDV39DRAFT_176318, partial [Aspergillus sergii]